MFRKLSCRIALIAVLAIAAVMPVGAADLLPQLPVPYLSPEEAVPKFIMAEPGYALEPVLSEPDIADPVACVFDGNGRLYVAEMRSYMQDLEGGNAHAPVSRVSVHWSSKGDGHFDKHAVFADKLHLPRMMLPLADGVLINETDSNDIYLYRDLNGDSVADKKELWYGGGARTGSIASQPSGLVWCLDNWIYTTQNP